MQCVLELTGWMRMSHGMAHPVVGAGLAPLTPIKGPIHQGGAIRSQGSLTPTENRFEEKRYPHFRYCAIYWYCFPGGISRREGFYAPPACHAITVNHRSIPLNGDGRERLCASRSEALARSRGVKPLLTRDLTAPFLSNRFSVGARDPQRPSPCANTPTGNGKPITKWTCASTPVLGHDGGALRGTSRFCWSQWACPCPKARPRYDIIPFHIYTSH